MPEVSLVSICKFAKELRNREFGSFVSTWKKERHVNEPVCGFIIV